MGDNDRQDAANKADEQAISEESDEQRADTRRIEKPEPTSAPAPGDDIIIK
jgi:hypothetical protein